MNSEAGRPDLLARAVMGEGWGAEESDTCAMGGGKEQHWEGLTSTAVVNWTW